MGLHVNIYKCSKFGDCTLNGVSSRDIEGLCLTNVEGPFDQHTMDGGNFAASSDSRFSQACRELLGHHFYGAVAIHDRVEDF